MHIQSAFELVSLRPHYTHNFVTELNAHSHTDVDQNWIRTGLAGVVCTESL